MQVLCIVGSLGRRSKNHELLETIERIAPAPLRLRRAPSLGDLPHFDPDLPLESAPHPVRELRRLVAESEALIILCPEYAFSLPGVLKNAIDWLVGTGELEGKIVAMTASVPHEQRGLMGLAALRQSLSAVSARVVFNETTVRGDEGLTLGRLFLALRLSGESVSETGLFG